MGAGPAQVVQSPPATPPLVSLVRSARRVDEPDDRWMNGFGFAPEGCAMSGILDPCDTGVEKEVPASRDSIDFEPYVIWAGDSCSSFGFSQRDYEARARRLLEACQSKQIAEEFWKGTVAQANDWPNRFLADVANVDLLTESGGVSPTQALSCLEQGLAECQCSQGMIHATPQVVTYWVSEHLVIREGGLLITQLGTIVVADGGYDGSDPNGNAPISGGVWAYGTGIVDVRLGPVQVFPSSMNEALNRSTNLVTFRAERMAAATWDSCCLVGAEIDIDLCSIGGS